MNPFEDYTTNSTTDTLDKPINIWVTQNGRKQNTYVSGWDIDETVLEENSPAGLARGSHPGVQRPLVLPRSPV